MEKNTAAPSAADAANFAANLTVESLQGWIKTIDDLGTKQGDVGTFVALNRRAITGVVAKIFPGYIIMGFSDAKATVLASQYSSKNILTGGYIATQKSKDTIAIVQVMTAGPHKVSCWPHPTRQGMAYDREYKQILRYFPTRKSAMEYAAAQENVTVLTFVSEHPVHKTGPYMSQVIEPTLEQLKAAGIDVSDEETTEETTEE